MIKSDFLSRRSVCISGGSLLAMGLAGCGPVVGPAVVGKMAGIFLNKFTRSSLVGEFGGYAIELFVQEAGLFEIQDSELAGAQQLSNLGQVKYEQFKQIPANYRLAYDLFIPEFSATVTNSTFSLINVGEVSCVMYSESGNVIEKIISDEYVNLEPGQSTTLSQFFRFSNLPDASIGYVMLETKYSDIERPLATPLLAIMATSTLTSA